MTLFKKTTEKVEKGFKETKNNIDEAVKETTKFVTEGSTTFKVLAGVLIAAAILTIAKDIVTITAAAKMSSALSHTPFNTNVYVSKGGN